MKKFYLIFIFTICLFNQVKITAQYNWQFQATSNPLHYIKCLSSTNTIIYSGNLGYFINENGIITNLINLGVNLGGNLKASSKTVSFGDSLNGYAVNNNTSLLITSNGSINWGTKYINIPFIGIYSIFFINKNTGWIGGKTNNGNTLIKSTNKGLNWSVITNNLQFIPGQIYMLNNMKGFIIPSDSTQSADSIGYTVNGGYNWSYFRAGNAQGHRATKLFFLDSLRGFILGYNNYISATTNGGLNWIYKENFLTNNKDIFFTDQLTGWITGTHKIYKSTDGGNSWVLNILNYSTDHFNSITFKNKNTGWAASNDGNLFATTNNGVSWSPLMNNIKDNFKKVFFYNNYTGWILGANILYKTTNSGFLWSPVSSFTGTDLILVNNNILFGSADNSVYKSTNGGNSWHFYAINSAKLKSINFINENTGWTCGDSGKIYQTTNSGVSWISKYFNNTKHFKKIQFVDNNTGFISTDYEILKTNNGGLNWSINLVPDSYNITDILFLNSLIGFITGFKTQYSGNNWYTTRVIFKTTDGCNNWMNMVSDVGGGYFSRFNDIYFYNDIGWVACSDKIMISLNQGNNWTSYNPTVSQNFTSVYFVNSSLGWLVSAGINNDYGTILTTLNIPLGIPPEIQHIPNNFYLHQNYPNPFNPITKILFVIPAKAGIHDYLVRLIVYNSLGQKIETIVNQELSPGTYEVSFDGSNYPSGVYFYQLTTNNFSETRKMVLLK